MGGNVSGQNSKRFRVRDNLRPVRWNYVDDLPINQNDSMNDPTYNLQGEPEDEYEEDGDFLNHDDVWLPRDETPLTTTTCDDAWLYDSGQFLYRETVLQDTPSRLHDHHKSVEDESTTPKTLEVPDHYDVIDDLKMDLSDTEQKQPVAIYKNNDHANVYHGLPKRRVNYEQMVEIFKPLIVNNVNVKRLLPHLPFLSNDECRIRAIEERDPHAAIIYLIDELCSGSKEPGRWKQFIHALESCGYKYIVDTLRGQEPVDHTYQRQYLKIITPKLRELIVPLEVVPALWSYDVISAEDKEEVIQIERMSGSLAATDKLLDMIPRRHKFWYSHFVDALKNAGRYEAVDILAIPEILDSGGEQGTKCNEMIDSSNKVEKNCRQYMSTTSIKNDYLEMIEDFECNEQIISDGFLDADESKENNDQDIDEIDDLYIKMRNPDNNIEIVKSNIENHSEHLNNAEVQETRYEEYNPTESKWEYRSLNGKTSEDSIHTKEFDLPPRIPRRMKNTNSVNTANLLEIDASSHSNSVEVIKLTTPEPKKNCFPEHIPIKSNRVKRIHKPPIPTPRKVNSRSEKHATKLQKCDDEQMLRKDKDADDVMEVSLSRSNMHEIRENESMEEEEDIIEKGIFVHKDPKSTKCSNPTTTIRNRKNRIKFFRKAKISSCRQTLKLTSNPTDQNNLGTISRKHSKSSDDAEVVSLSRSNLHAFLENEDLKRHTCSRPRSTIRNKKNKGKFVRKTKINIRRKTLKLKSNPQIQNNLDAICRDQGKRIALVYREKLALPTMRRSESIKDDYFKRRSKSLPTEVEKGIGSHQGPNNLGEGTSRKSKEANEATLSYSEPFRCFRIKDDEDIFATVDQVMPGTNHVINQGNTWDFAKNLVIEKNQIQPEVSPDTDELLDILASCNIKHDDDQVILKSNTEIKPITENNLNPELKKALEKVRDLEYKLNHEFHNGKILRKTLQLQGDVNEILKRNRRTRSELSVKEKEATALEAATVELCDSELVHFDEFQPKDKDASQQANISSFASGNKNSLQRGGSFIQNTCFTTEKNLCNEEKETAGAFDKDSAFYSEFTTKL